MTYEDITWTSVYRDIYGAGPSDDFNAETVRNELQRRRQAFAIAGIARVCAKMGKEKEFVAGAAETYCRAQSESSRHNSLATWNDGQACALVAEIEK